MRETVRVFRCGRRSIKRTSDPDWPKPTTSPLVTVGSSVGSYGTQFSPRMEQDVQPKKATSDALSHMYDFLEWNSPIEKGEDEDLDEVAARNFRLASLSGHIKDEARAGVRQRLIQEKESEDNAAVEALTMFAMMDLDGDGVVTEEEFRAYLARFSYTEAASTRIFKIFTALDADENGEISVEKVRTLIGSLVDLAYFVEGSSIAPWTKVGHAEADRIFDDIDANGDGEISSTELHSYLKRIGYSEIASDNVLRSLDSNDDGKLSRSEVSDGFKKYLALREAVMTLVNPGHVWLSQ